MAHVDFAPDGKHWQTIKKGKIARMYDYFTHTPDLLIQIHCNPYAKFRLVGNTGEVIGTLPQSGSRSVTPM